MPEVEIPCVQCKNVFIFTEKEQEKFYQQNLMSPQRCPTCRSKKMAKRADAPDRYEIVCDNCGKNDSVPFQPKVGRSVLCKDCHSAKRSKSKAVKN